MSGMSGTEDSPPRRRRLPTVPLLLLFLALMDLRVELALMWDHFTFAGLAAAIRSHLLAFIVIALQPSLWRHYRGQRV
jgi:hypothetical protein